MEGGLSGHMFSISRMVERVEQLMITSPIRWRGTPYSSLVNCSRLHSSFFYSLIDFFHSLPLTIHWVVAHLLVSLPPPAPCKSSTYSTHDVPLEILSSWNRVLFHSFSFLLRTSVHVHHPVRIFTLQVFYHSLSASGFWDKEGTPIRNVNPCHDLLELSLTSSGRCSFLTSSWFRKGQKEIG